MKRKLILVSALGFSMSGVIQLAQARHFVDLSELCGATVDSDMQVRGNGHISIAGDCTIEVDDAKLEIVAVKVDVEGDLTINDISDTESGEASGLVIRNSQVATTGKVKIEKSWDGGVVFRNNRVATGDDLRVKPVGLGDLIFRNNKGEVSGDIRLGDSGLQGDMYARNNMVDLDGDFRAASTDGDMVVRNNEIRNVVSKVQITSDGGGDISVKQNSFRNSETAQEVEITTETGDAGVLNNGFGESVIAVTIESNDGGQCESNRNSPEVVDTNACLL